MDDEPDKELLIDNGDSTTSGDVGDKECNEESSEESEKMVEWAYKVMDWLVYAVDAKAYSEIFNRMEDIITAFLVLVKDEHRGIVMDTFRKILDRVRE